MNTKKAAIAIVLSMIWISLSEFVRNEFLLKSLWVNHYTGMGIVFPSEPLNGVVWGVWALCFSIINYIVLRRFSFNQTIALSWIIGFVLMWLVIGNLGVLPMSILVYAIPLSILEVYVSVLIIYKIDKSI